MLSNSEPEHKAKARDLGPSVRAGKKSNLSTQTSGSNDCNPARLALPQPTQAQSGSVT